MPMDENKAIRDVCLALVILAMVFAACDVAVTREIGLVRRMCLEAGHSVLECQQSTRGSS